MSAKAIRERSALISARFHAERDVIAGGSETVVSLEQIDRFEALASGTVYLLRDNNAACIRGEQLRQRSSSEPVLDLDYADAKAEIESMINALIRWKFELREARQEWLDQRRESALSEDHLQLASMYQSGVLTTAQFESLKARLDAGQALADAQRAR